MGKSETRVELWIVAKSLIDSRHADENDRKIVPVMLITQKFQWRWGPLRARRSHLERSRFARVCPKRRPNTHPNPQPNLDAFAMAAYLVSGLVSPWLADFLGRRSCDTAMA